MAVKRNPSDRFWEKVDRDGPLPKWAPFLGPCWLWTACIFQGYGTFQVGGKSVGAHRWSYEHHVGPIPEGLVIDHLCRVRACVRPDHLEPVTSRENIARGQVGRWWALKTHCPEGHEYTPENTRINRQGSRECRACRADHSARARAKRLAKGLPDGDERHGTENGYGNWGCRCDPCCAAKAADGRHRRKG